jgi:hypothetical protein
MSGDDRQMLFLTIMFLGVCVAMLGMGKEGERRARQEADLLSAKMLAERDRGAK